MSEEVLKIDLSQKVSDVQRQERKISDKIHIVKFEITSSAESNAYYAIDKGTKPIQGEITIPRWDGEDRYVKKIDVEEHRNSSLTVRFYAFGQIHTELILKIVPPQLLVKSVLFKDGGKNVPHSSIEVNSGSNFVVTVNLSRSVMDGENAKLHCQRYFKKIGSNKFTECVAETVELKNYVQSKEFTFYAPRNHSGGVMAISCYVKGRVDPDESKEQHSVRYYKISL